MAKIIYLFLALLAINMALYLFGCASYSEGVCIPESSIWTFLFNPQDIGSSGFLETLLGNAGLLALVGGGFITAAAYIFKAEAAIYAGIAVALAGVLVNTWIKYYRIISGSGLFGDAATIIAVLFIGPIIIYILFTLLDWARGKD